MGGRQDRLDRSARPIKSERTDEPIQTAQPPRTFSLTLGQTRTWLGFILVFHLALGAVAIYQDRASPFFNLPIIDEEAYVNWADKIAAGDLLGDKIFYQDPLYPYFLGLLFAVLGKSLLLVRAVQMAMSNLGVLLVFWTARRLKDDKHGLLAAAIVALYGGTYFFPLKLVKATMVFFLAAIACALGVWAAERARAFGRWLGLGLAVGCLVLLRGNMQAVAPVLIAWSFFIDRAAPIRSRLTAPLAFALGLALILAPVTIRNYVVGGEWVLTTSQAGANFYIGNNERADGRYVTLPFVRANPEWEATDFEKEAERISGKDLKPTEVSSFWFGQAFKWMRENPRAAVRMMLMKARFMIHSHEVPDNHSFYLFRQEFVGALWVPFLRHGYLWGPALIGMFILARRDRRAQFPALFTVLYAASLIPFFIVARYRAPTIPGLAVFASVFVFWLCEDWRGLAGQKRVAALAVAAIFVFLGVYPTGPSRAPMGAEYYLLGNGYLKTGHPREAAKCYDYTLKVQPGHADAAKNRAEAMLRINAGEVGSLVKAAETAGAPELVEMGRRFEGLGQFKAAVEAYEQACQKDPRLFSPQARLGFLYATRPELQDPEKALQHLLAAIEIDPQSFDTMNALGNVNFILQRKDEAVRWWKKTLELKPDHAGARQNLEKMGQ